MLQVIPEALVTRVVFKDPVSEDLFAIGAEFVYQGVTHFAKSEKEVILSAGCVLVQSLVNLCLGGSLSCF